MSDEDSDSEEDFNPFYLYDSSSSSDDGFF